MLANEHEEETTGETGDDLRQTDRAVEQTKVRAHVGTALQRIGDNGKRQGQHGSPGATDEGKRYEQRPLVGHERHEGKASAANDKADGIGGLQTEATLKSRKHHSPQHAGHRLDGKDNAHPVAGCLEVGRLGIGGVPHGVGNGTGGIVPHKQESEPAEELYQRHAPVVARGVAQKLDEVDVVFLLFGGAVILGIFLWRHLTDVDTGVDDADDEDDGTHVERHLQRGGHTVGGVGAQADIRHEERQGEADHLTEVAQETLDGIGQTFLLLIDHVTNHHLERLHGHVERGVEEHQDNGAKRHGHPERVAQAAGIGQQRHHDDGDDGTDDEVRDATTETAPRAVAEHTDDGLHDHAHQRGQHPEKTEALGVGAHRGEDAGDITTLQRISNLHTKEAEAEIEQRQPA